MRFSARTGWPPGLNAWAEAVQAARHSGQDVIDLTTSNPTACGLGLHDAAVLAPLSTPEVLQYQPEPFGMLPARRAVEAYYRDHDRGLSPDQICLTTSTSEAYSFLFRLLCDPGDEVLIARPSYPLFDLLATVQDVTLREYPLLYDPGLCTGQGSGWVVDFAALEASITPRTRAIVVVHPNNPTGHYVTNTERNHMVALCARRGLALIVDEVFLDYALDPASRPGSYAGDERCLCFVLSGLSKICALPQMKLSWIVTSGGQHGSAEALRRLEIIADTYLSVNAPVQAALTPWLASRKAVQTQVRQRTAENIALLDEHLRGSLGDRLPMEGGWTAVLRVPRFVEDDEFAMIALRRGVVVQPGVVYGLPAGRCVVSLLPPPELFLAGIRRLPV